MSIALKILSGLGLFLTSTYLGLKTFKKVNSYKFTELWVKETTAISASVGVITGVYFTYPYSLAFPFAIDFMEYVYYVREKSQGGYDDEDYDRDLDKEEIKGDVENNKEPLSPELKLSPIRINQKTPSVESDDEYSDYVKLEKLI